MELDENALTAFENLKQALISAQCLVIFVPTMLTETWADASREWGTVGAVLMQDHRLGLQPVVFLSKVMTKEQITPPMSRSCWPTLRVKDLEQEMFRVTTKDGAKHKVLLNLNTKKREAQEEEIPKVFDNTTDPDYV